MEWHWFANFLPYLTTETECTSGDPLGPLVVTPGEVGVTSGLLMKWRGRTLAALDKLPICAFTNTLPQVSTCLFCQAGAGARLGAGLLVKQSMF